MASRTRAARSSSPAQDVLHHVLRFMRRVSGVIARDRRGADFSPSQKFALFLLEEQGAVSMGSLARGLGLSTAAATRIVDRLEEARLARRRQGPNRRTVLVGITPAGRRSAARFHSFVEAMISRTLSRLPASAVPTIVAYYRGLEEAAAEVGARIRP